MRNCQAASDFIDRDGTMFHAEQTLGSYEFVSISEETFSNIYAIMLIIIDISSHELLSNVQVQFDAFEKQTDQTNENTI